MTRFLLRIAVFLGSAALGLLAAHLLLEDFTLSLSGFLAAVILFALAQSLLAPLTESMARKHAPALLGGIGVISTFVALLVATLFAGGLSISGISTWILATLIVWLVTALAAWFLPKVLLKDRDTKGTSTPGSAKPSTKHRATER